jgi:Fe-S-cluster containining protein
MIVPLQRSYTARYGTPTVHQVDTDIFIRTWFGDCMACDYCHDICCQFGTTVDRPTVQKILDKADDLERLTGMARSEWFRNEWDVDADCPGGFAGRTAVLDGICVFANRHGRGCLIHRYALETGLDVHEIKPMVCLTFPLYWSDGTLVTNVEIADGTLVCLGRGPSVYRSTRQEVEYYFGAELVAELDQIERTALRDLPAQHPAVAGRTIPLPLIA